MNTCTVKGYLWLVAVVLVAVVVVAVVFRLLVHRALVICSPCYLDSEMGMLKDLFR